MTGQMDHASNPRGRRKAREGERRMHAERQRAKDAPMTAEQVRARLEEIAPCPAGEGPGTARALAAWLLVSAQRAWYRGLRPGGTDADISMAGGSFATAHALLALERVSDSHADIAAAEILTAIGADEAAGERVARHLRDLGVDPDEVSRLEEARQALPEVREPQ